MRRALVCFLLAGAVLAPPAGGGGRVCSLGPGAALGPRGWGASRVPRTRYDLADRCLAVRGGEPLFFKATGLGTYMVRDRAGRLLTERDGAVTRATTPGVAAEWRASRVAARVYALRSSADDHLLSLRGATR